MCLCVVYDVCMRGVCVMYMCCVYVFVRLSECVCFGLVGKRLVAVVEELMKQKCRGINDNLNIGRYFASLPGVG